MPSTIVPEGYMMNALGNLIAKENVTEFDIARTEFVQEKAAKIIAMHDALKALKHELLEDFSALIDLSNERYKVDIGKGKGNVGLCTFDGSLKLDRNVSDCISFNECLLAAKALIDECLREWTKDSESHVKTLVDHAFRVDKKGKINTAAVLSLRSLKIDDEKWKRAMDAINDSISVTNTSTYVRLLNVTKMAHTN